MKKTNKTDLETNKLQDLVEILEQMNPIEM